MAKPHTHTHRTSECVDILPAPLTFPDIDSVTVFTEINIMVEKLPLLISQTANHTVCASLLTLLSCLNFLFIQSIRMPGHINLVQAQL